ncbi:hypothetical protein [Spirochaeta cellobiosiphila]|uniref:hypothetical protein n=1 Tax=Spirochaeta cellobiosiphila TaxID=504483 RepID=UPI00041412D6|nr:hypothetical protein [Spirochaeta cellobiosiphila]
MITKDLQDKLQELYNVANLYKWTSQTEALITEVIKKAKGKMKEALQSALYLKMRQADSSKEEIIISLILLSKLGVDLDRITEKTVDYLMNKIYVVDFQFLITHLFPQGAPLPEDLIYDITSRVVFDIRNSYDRIARGFQRVPKKRGSEAILYLSGLICRPDLSAQNRDLLYIILSKVQLPLPPNLATIANLKLIDIRKKLSHKSLKSLRNLTLEGEDVPEPEENVPEEFHSLEQDTMKSRKNFLDISYEDRRNIELNNRDNQSSDHQEAADRGSLGISLEREQDSSKGEDLESLRISSNQGGDKKQDRAPLPEWDRIASEEHETEAPQSKKSTPKASTPSLEEPRPVTTGIETTIENDPLEDTSKGLNYKTSKDSKAPQIESREENSTTSYKAYQEAGKEDGIKLDSIDDLFEIEEAKHLETRTGINKKTTTADTKDSETRKPKKARKKAPSRKDPSEKAPPVEAENVHKTEISPETKKGLSQSLGGLTRYWKKILPFLFIPLIIAIISALLYNPMNDPSEPTRNNNPTTEDVKTTGLSYIPYTLLA